MAVFHVIHLLHSHSEPNIGSPRTKPFRYEIFCESWQGKYEMSNLCETLMGPLTGDSKMNKQVQFWSLICRFWSLLVFFFDHIYLFDVSLPNIQRNNTAMFTRPSTSSVFHVGWINQVVNSERVDGPVNKTVCHTIYENIKYCRSIFIFSLCILLYFTVSAWLYGQKP